MIDKVVITVGNTTIETKIENKTKAKEKYDDAVASGKTAVLVQENETKEELITLNIGNILPSQEVEIIMSLLMFLKVEAGAFLVKWPLTYFPNYEYSDKSKQFFYNYNINLDI